MSKYDPLRIYLEGRRFEELPMTFAEIESVIGFKLPEKSQSHRAWWSNNPSNSVMTKAWLAAGYKTERVDMAGRKLVFKRIRDYRDPQDEEKRGPRSSGSREVSARDAGQKGHPLFGALAGLAKTAPGVDLTEPADPTWGDQA
jgi:hypothetical protein